MIEVILNTSISSPRRTILIPIDVSETSFYTAEWALKQIVNCESDNIILINVRHEHIPHSKSKSNNGDKENSFRIINEDLKLESHELLKSFSNLFIENHGHVKAICLVGDPRTEVLAWIKLNRPDQVIMGNRGRAALSGNFGLNVGLFLGSVSQHILQHSPVPVTVVPNPKLVE
ncbi:hypothetical protein HK103_006036 [Boothiomyces macroporosus]|uniref:UspA domain-containing protein n=1 Tax=Boothiomyces macroporosus TaxID=261099 RepID=A0AAD5UEP6_9FUNG|nr:hypothetical protein HK103_006036 [Boothiomyces macroporosus]